MTDTVYPKKFVFGPVAIGCESLFCARSSSAQMLHSIGMYATRRNENQSKSRMRREKSRYGFGWDVYNQMLKSCFQHFDSLWYFHFSFFFFIVFFFFFFLPTFSLLYRIDLQNQRIKRRIQAKENFHSIEEFQHHIIKSWV